MGQLVGVGGSCRGSWASINGSYTKSVRGVVGSDGIECRCPWSFGG